MKQKPFYPDPLAALRIIERRLRGRDSYHLAMDREAKIGMGQWIKGVIRRNRPSRPAPLRTFKKEYIGVNEATGR